MAYYSGTAASLTALRTALLTHAQADGWVLTGDVLSKAGVFFKITVTADNIELVGCEDNAGANPAPKVMIGLVYIRSGYPTRQISFPCNYEVFGFAQELYLVVNYDTDTYQWMAFGKSTVPGLPGQGGWCGATNGSYFSDAIFDSLPREFYLTSSTGGSPDGTAGVNCGALFWNTNAANAWAARCSWVNSGLDGHGWLYGSTDDVSPIGPRHHSMLLDVQPSVWNSEAVLLPLRCYKERPSFKVSLTADLQNARTLRIDNLSPGDILTLGSDKWKVFPWYRKDINHRSVGAVGFYNHTGTFGWAVRYEGP